MPSHDFLATTLVAKQNHFVQEEALANELAGEYFLSIHNEFVGQAHLREALEKYAQWGARAKEVQLRQRYAFLSVNSLFDKPHLASPALLERTNSHNALDVAALFHEETDDVQKLVLKIESVFREQWNVPVARLCLAKTWCNSLSEPLAPQTSRYRPIPKVLDEYVCDKKKPVSTRHPDWKKFLECDAYFAEHRPAAAICAPLICLDRLVGCIYLEHPVDTSLFADSDIDMIEVFSAQAASALESARVYLLFMSQKRALQEQISLNCESTERMESGSGTPGSLALQDEESASQLKDTLLDLMGNKKLYRDCQLSLERLADEASSQPRLVSEVLNVCLGRNFYRFVNDFRIEEVTRRLADSSEKESIINIATQAGFGAKSSFNSFFKELTGCTPSTYRKQFIR